MPTPSGTWVDAKDLPHGVNVNGYARSRDSKVAWPIFDTKLAGTFPYEGPVEAEPNPREARHVRNGGLFFRRTADERVCLGVVSPDGSLYHSFDLRLIPVSASASRAWLPERLTGLPGTLFISRDPETGHLQATWQGPMSAVRPSAEGKDVKAELLNKLLRGVSVHGREGTPAPQVDLAGRNGNAKAFSTTNDPHPQILAATLDEGHTLEIWRRIEFDGSAIYRQIALVTSKKGHREITYSLHPERSCKVFCVSRG